MFKFDKKENIDLLSVIWRIVNHEYPKESIYLFMPDQTMMQFWNTNEKLLKVETRVHMQDMACI